MFRLIPVLLLSGCNQGFDYWLHPPQVRVWDESNPPELEGEFRTDHIIADNTSDTTVLVVIDNSVSMDDEQERLKLYVPKLLNGLISSGRNFHFGTTVSDCDLNYEWTNEPTPCGIVNWIEGGPSYDPDETRAEAAELINVGYFGSSIEKFLQPIHGALSKSDEENKGFLYDEGPIHFLGITDEPDQTDPEREDDVLAELIGLKNTHAVLTLSTLVAIEDQPPTPWYAYTPGCDAIYDQDLIDYPQMFSGSVGDICAEDWDLFIEEMSEKFIKRQTTFFLERFPVVETIEVSVIHQGATIFPEDNTWTYDGIENSITFNALFPEEYLDEVVIDYQVR